MPKKYFQMIPTISYDVDGSGVTKVAVDVLRRVKARADILADGAVFYNYQMQSGDNAEIIADKYYGSPHYHWVVLLMNNIIDHTYDFALSDTNFERFLNAEYGSLVRAEGVTINLASTDILSGTIAPNWYTIEQSAGDFGVQGANTVINMGTFPIGNSTAITIKDEFGADPFVNIDVGDVIHVFVPERWYEDSGVSIVAGQLAEDSAANNEIYLDLGSSQIDAIYNGATITITGESGSLGITGNVRTINVHTSETNYATLASGFLDDPQDDWTYTIEYFTPDGNYKKIAYTAPAKVIAKSVYTTGSIDTDEDSDSFDHWIPDSQNDTRFFQINTNLNANTFGDFSWDETEFVYIQTGIHHFEMDFYDAAGTTKLANNIHISQKQYQNTTFGVATHKSIVSNYTFADEANEDKRNIYLLKREYLGEFVREFEALMKQGA